MLLSSFTCLVALFVFGADATGPLLDVLDLTRIATDPENAKRLPGQLPAPKFNKSLNTADNFIALIRERALPGEHQQMPPELLDMVTTHWRPNRCAHFQSTIASLWDGSPSAPINLERFLDHTELIDELCFRATLYRTFPRYGHRVADHYYTRPPLYAFVRILYDWHVHKGQRRYLQRSLEESEEYNVQRRRVFDSFNGERHVLAAIDTLLAAPTYHYKDLRLALKAHAGVNVAVLAFLSRQVLIEFYTRVLYEPYP